MFVLNFNKDGSFFSKKKKLASTRGAPQEFDAKFEMENISEHVSKYPNEKLDCLRLH